MLKKLLPVRFNRKWLWIPAGVLLVLVLGAAGVWCYVPYHYAKYTMPGYLEQNQRYFRAENVQPGKFNYVKLTDISLGNSAKPLLNAPEGRVYLEYTGGRKGLQPSFKRLELFDAALAMNVHKRRITLNGIPLAEFLAQITDLPTAPDGAVIPLVIHFKFQLVKAAVSDLVIIVNPGARAEDFLISGQWQTAGAAQGDGEKGEWKVLYERDSGNMAITLNGGVAPHFLQEILLRSHEPELTAALIQSGRITGKGTFAAHMPELSVSDITFTGTVKEAAFSWQKLSLRAEKPFDFELRKSGQKCSWSAPSIELSRPFRIPLTNVRIERKVKKAEVYFQAVADLRETLVRVLREQTGLESSLKTAMPRRISGVVNARTMVWDFTGSSLEEHPDNPEKTDVQELLFEDARKRTLAITADRFTLHGHGKAAAGNIESELGLRNLALTLPEGSFRAERLDLRSMRQLGDDQYLYDDRIEFHSNKLTGDTPQGQCEIANFSGELGIHRPSAGETELKWIARGDSLLLFSKNGEVRSGNWQGTATCLRDMKSGDWTLSTLDMHGDKTTVRAGSESGDLSGLKLHLAGSVKEGKITLGEVRLRATGLAGKRAKAKSPELNFTYDGTKPHWSGEFTAGLLEIPFGSERPWLAKKCTVRAEGTSFTLPEKLYAEAESLDAAYAGWLGEFRNGKWQLAHHAGLVECETGFDALHVTTPNRVEGNGDLGSSQAKVALKLRADGSVKECNATLESIRPSWSWEELHSSGESGKVEFRYDADAGTTYAGNISLKHATLLNTYFSILAPEITYRAEYAPALGAKGDFTFEKGIVSSPGSRLELADSSLKLPWSLSSNGAATQAAGSLTAGELCFDGEAQGPFTAEIIQNNATLDIQGTLAARLFSNAPLSLNAHVQLPPERPSLTAKLDLPLSELAAPVEPGRWFPQLSGTMLKGRFAFGATVESNAAKSSSAAIVIAENSDWQIGNTLLEGVSGQAEFSDFGQFITRTAFPLSVRRFHWQDYELANSRATLAFLPGNKLSVSAWNAKFGDGAIELTAPVEFNYATSADAGKAKTCELNFNVDKIPLAELLHKLGMNAVESDAAVTGKVQTRYQDGKLHYLDSRVAFRSNIGEFLKMGNIEGAIIRMKDPVYQAFVQAVLKELRATAGDFEFTEQGRDLVMKIKAEGRPARPVPFVYQGSAAKSLFRATEPGEAGFDGEIEFNVKLKIGAPAYRVRLPNE